MITFQVISNALIHLVKLFERYVLPLSIRQRLYENSIKGAVGRQTIEMMKWYYRIDETPEERALISSGEYINDLNKRITAIEDAIQENISQHATRIATIEDNAWEKLSRK